MCDERLNGGDKERTRKEGRKEASKEGSGDRSLGYVFAVRIPNRPPRWRRTTERNSLTRPTSIQGVAIFWI